MVQRSLISFFYDTAALKYISDQTKLKTHQKPRTIPTWNTIATFDPPNWQVMLIFFLKLSGYHAVSQLSRLEHSELVLRPFENFSNLVLDSLKGGLYEGRVEMPVGTHHPMAQNYSVLSQKLRANFRYYGTQYYCPATAHWSEQGDVIWHSNDFS